MTTPSDTPNESRYEVVVVGSGLAGLTTALYAARLGHEPAVFDRGGGRAAMMRDTHNVIGTPESVSGAEFLDTAVEQLRSYGADYRQKFVTGVERTDDVVCGVADAVRDADAWMNDVLVSAVDRTEFAQPFRRRTRRVLALIRRRAR